ncbi:MAG: hypothetical protein CTY12_02595 [Methylotenera sp.]|nr:MAG: hypothetical protein CTY12_02595 [Methylotenera sp.]
MATTSYQFPIRRFGVWSFILIQICVILLAISNESLWIDEFVTAYYASLHSLDRAYELLFISKGSQTPLHYLYYYFWGQLFEPNEFNLRLANLPLFVLGQLSLFLALRAYPRNFGFFFLILSAFHPMVWQYANEARPYIMMYAGSQMILAYILHIHSIKSAGENTNILFSGIFVAGCILLFGSSMLGGFWVLTALAYVAYFHYRYLNWRYLKSGANLMLVCILLIITLLLGIYYLKSVLEGGGASRVSSTTFSTLLFDFYELLGLSGLGPGRTELRGTGAASLGNYWILLLLAGAVFSAILIRGLKSAVQLMDKREFVYVAIVTLLPVVIIVISGFAMHWRVLGRHLISVLPVLNMVYALGIVGFLNKDYSQRRKFLVLIIFIFLLLIAYSAVSMRFSDKHKKDDYRAAANIALLDISQGKHVWWAAYGLGAQHYGVPIKYDIDSEFKNIVIRKQCIDESPVKFISDAPRECLESLTQPDTIILSKLETFDPKGEIVTYLNTNKYVKVQAFSAFTIWRRVK